MSIENAKLVSVPITIVPKDEVFAAIMVELYSAISVAEKALSYEVDFEIPVILDSNVFELIRPNADPRYIRFAVPSEEELLERMETWFSDLEGLDIEIEDLGADDFFLCVTLKGV
jgi:hypothetical protein